MSADQLASNSAAWTRDTPPISLDPATPGVVELFATLLAEADQLTHEGIDRLIANLKADREARRP